LTWSSKGYEKAEENETEIGERIALEDNDDERGM
jgi:hypothetical protein